MSNPPKKAARKRIRRNLYDALEALIAVQFDPECPMVVRCAVDGAIVCIVNHALTQKSIQS